MEFRNGDYDENRYLKMKIEMRIEIWNIKIDIRTKILKWRYRWEKRSENRDGDVGKDLTMETWMEKEI